DGVSSAQVNIANEKATVEFDEGILTKQNLEEAIKAVGYYVVDKTKSLELEQINCKKEVRMQKLKLIVAAVFTIPLFYIAMAPMITFIQLPYPNFLRPEINAALFALVQVVLVIPVIFAGYKFYTNGFASLFKLHPNMDSLVAVSTTAAFLYSIYSTIQILLGDIHGAHRLYFESVGVIIALILLGKFLEARSKGKTGEAIRALMSLAPKTANVIRDGVEMEISVDDVKIGDTVIIKPGQSLPVDGVITLGTTSIDESMLTGESMPVDKQVSDKVYAATINKNGSVSYRAERVGEDTTLSKIISLVEEAAGSKAPIAHLADVISGWFTPTVMVIALLSAIAWLIAKQDIEFALTIFISILVIACPCALGLATPTAIIVGTGKGASLGVLFKNAAALQATHSLHTVIFDKTGTITLGKPQVCDIVPFNFDEDKLVSLAASLENSSEHPLGQAIVSYAKEKGITINETSGFQSVTGCGIEATIEGALVKIGNTNYVKASKLDIVDALSEQGKTPMLISVNDKLVGVIAVADMIKDSSKSAIAELHKMGLKTVMLTGDNQKTANAIAKLAGIDKVKAGVLPDGKVEAIMQYKKGRGLVAMVGDGINDAPALTAADVGIAVGSGADVAIESADVILVKNDLNDVVTAIKLSKATMRNIKQNLFWAFCYNVLGIPVAAGLLYLFGGPLLNPMFAAAAMSLSSVSVVTNALRLNTFNPLKK
ncbi:MAG: heavy metal translocating P-type ATPase, partial [Oscillospiraceae bacterium]